MNFDNSIFAKSVIWLITFSVAAIIYKLISYITRKAGPEDTFMTTLDRCIPFLPWTVFVYYSVHFLVVPLIVSSRIDIAEFSVTAIAVFVMFSTFSLIYLILPAAFPRPQVKLARPFSYRLIRHLYDSDSSNNTLPSTHAGLVTIFLCSAYGQFPSWVYVPYVLWAISVIVSTLTVKQHHVIDAVTGVIFSSLIYYGLRL